MTSEANEALLNKIQKLMALRDKNDNIHQAEAAAAKIQELIAEHGINLVELEAAGQRKKESIIKSSFKFHEPPHDAPDWEVMLAQLVAKANYCRLLVIGKTPKGANWINGGAIVGQPHDVEVTLYFFVYLRDTIWRLSLKAHKEYFGTGARRDWRWLMDYGKGAALAVGNRLVNQKRQAEQAAASSSTALMVLKDKEVDDWIGETKSAGSFREAKYAYAEAVGYRDGQNIPINDAIEAEERRRLA